MSPEWREREREIDIKMSQQVSNYILPVAEITADPEPGMTQDGKL